MRGLKGEQIAKTGRIVKLGDGWRVPSQSGKGTYTVSTASLLSKPKCTCPDYETRGVICKHMYAVEIILQKEINVDEHGNTTITKTKRLRKSRIPKTGLHTIKPSVMKKTSSKNFSMTYASLSHNRIMSLEDPLGL